MGREERNCGEAGKSRATTGVVGLQSSVVIRNASLVKLFSLISIHPTLNREKSPVQLGVIDYTYWQHPLLLSFPLKKNRKFFLSTYLLYPLEVSVTVVRNKITMF